MIYIIKRINYFDDAENEKDPVLYCYSNIREEVKKLIKNEINKINLDEFLLICKSNLY
jgi:hypothetical protein